MEKHHFERPHLIAGYRNEQFVGIFVTRPKETLTTEELVDYFEAANPTCFVAEEIPELDIEITPENYMDLLQDMIESYMESEFSDLPLFDLLYIPKTLH